MLRLYTTPAFFRMFYPSLIWKMPSEGKKLYLTFDDGPHPIITPRVLSLLNKYDAKATFFCIGKNVEAHKDIFNMIKEEGHSVGNHTFNHNKGWDTNTNDYVESVERSNELIQSDLLRPPHGRIKFSQIRRLKKKYRIVAWSVISYDWDRTLSHEECYKNVIKNAKSGSIIVFHDSVKAVGKMLPVLEKVLEYYTNKGFSFEKL